MRALTWLGLALALLGPGLLATLWSAASLEPVSARTSAPWLAGFALLVAAVAWIARRGEGLAWRELGFGRTSWWSVPAGIALALFFVLVFGPLASWALARAALGAFAAGQQRLAALPGWYLALTVVIVAAGEEWLYRAYAIERLRALTGSAGRAGALSLAVFAVVHLPVWGIGPALATLVSGGILTAAYLWRRDIAALMLAHVLTDLCGLLLLPGGAAPAPV